MRVTRPTEEKARARQAVRSAEDIRELVKSASAVIAHYWPMTTFVHHNPIAGLEKLPFRDAVALGRRFVGGHGYLSNELYRRLSESGRIRAEHLDAALSPLSRDATTVIGGRPLSHIEVLRANILTGISPPGDETIRALVDRDPAAAEIRALTERLSPDVERRDEASRLGRDLTLLTWCDMKLNGQLEWLINKELIKWCEAFLDEGHAPLPMPYREDGFYAAWRSLAQLEWSPCGISNSGRKIRALSESPEDALMAHLQALAIPPELQQDYLTLSLTSLNGWASFINWRSEHGTYEWQAAFPIDLTQYLAVRLFYERELVDQTLRRELEIEGNYNAVVSYLKGTQDTGNFSPVESARLSWAWSLSRLAGALRIPLSELIAADPVSLEKLIEWLSEFPESEHGYVWLTAHESSYHEDLIGKLKGSLAELDEDGGGPSRPPAQLVFCIDVRSEPFRRNLESVGTYETFGFAGFFGVPVSCRALNQHHLTAQVPAIVEPRFTVHEVVRQEEKERLARHNAGVSILHTIQEMLHDMKSHVLTPYVMVESLGWLFGVQLFGRTLFPEAYRKWRARINGVLAPPIGTIMATDRDDDGLGLTVEEQCATVETVLKTMGLTGNFARLVLLCGHTSTSDNNPYEAALNCGACGGNSGKPNARILATMANKPHVREHLASKGIDVPSDSHFIGAVHNTTTDSIELFDLEDLPETHLKDLERLKTDLEKAASRTNRERCLRLPGAGDNLSARGVAKEIGRRAGDWSETRPEWGLAGNAAFIIGKRSLTRSIDLEGRSFLNSHNYQVDPTGELIEGIMLGPMVVGQWINAEHYFSATDTEVYGSGSKIYHNVVGRIGIMSGPQSDLRTGLAWQSMMNGDQVYHEPLRLLVVIEAPHQRIVDILERRPMLKQLCDNQWIHLLVIDPESQNKFYKYRPGKEWETI